MKSVDVSVASCSAVFLLFRCLKQTDGIRFKGLKMIPVMSASLDLLVPVCLLLSPRAVLAICII